jgi:mRNA-degrading endonuclease toxin of MazEF toxin-antitoxin module
MPTDCVLSFDNLRWVRKSLLTRRVTTLPGHRWSEVCNALLFTVSC